MTTMHAARRSSFLREMGFPVVWQLRSRAEQVSEQQVATPEEIQVSVAPAPEVAQSPSVTARPKGMPPAPVKPSAEVAQPQTTAAPALTPALSSDLSWLQDLLPARGATRPQANQRQTPTSPVAKQAPAANFPPPSSPALADEQPPVWDEESFTDISGPVSSLSDDDVLAMFGDLPAQPEQAGPSPQALRAQRIAKMDWQELQTAVAACEACGLCRQRKQAVLGVGDPQAEWLLVGEGPGRTEDAQGEPFVGKSGKLLDNMLQALDLRRGANVYIANIVKCRPSDAQGNDRAPSLEEAAACRPFLERQIALLQPKVVLALGKTAAISLLHADPGTAVSSLRGKVQQFYPEHLPQALPLIVTYHPAYLLRKPADKARAWADLCLARQSHGPR